MRILAIVLMFLLAACADQSPIAPAASTSSKPLKIGLIDNLPVEMVSDNYGTFAGLSAWRAFYPAPFDVGGEFLAQLKKQIEARGAIAVIVPSPPEIAQTRPASAHATETDNWNENGDWLDWKNRKPYAIVGSSLDQLAAANGISMFIVMNAFSGPPAGNTYLPQAFSYGVYAKEHKPFAGFKYVFMEVGCILVDVATKHAESICYAPDVIELKDYKGPGKKGDPLPRLGEVTSDLHRLIELRAAAAADRLFGPATPKR